MKAKNILGIFVLSTFMMMGVVAHGAQHSPFTEFLAEILPTDPTEAANDIITLSSQHELFLYPPHHIAPKHFQGLWNGSYYSLDSKNKSMAVMLVVGGKEVYLIDKSGQLHEPRRYTFRNNELLATFDNRTIIALKIDGKGMLAGSQAFTDHSNPKFFTWEKIAISKVEQSTDKKNQQVIKFDVDNLPFPIEVQAGMSCEGSIGNLVKFKIKPKKNESTLSNFGNRQCSMVFVVGNSTLGEVPLERKCIADFDEFIKMFMSLSSEEQFNYINIPFKIGKITDFESDKGTIYKVYNSIEALSKLNETWPFVFPMHEMIKKNKLVMIPISDDQKMQICLGLPESSCDFFYTFMQNDGCWQMTETLENDSGI